MYIIEKEIIHQIPMLHIYKKSLADSPAPVVMFWHGFSSAKEHNLPIAYQLAEKNIRVLLPEAMLHGERSEDLSEKERMSKFWKIVVQSVRDTETVYNEIKRRNWLLDDRLFVGGTSMGAILTFGALKVYPWIKGGISLMGDPAWTALARAQLEGLKRNNLWEESEEKTQEILQGLHPFDLSTAPEAIAGRPLFFWHGQEDEVVPYQSAYHLYKTLEHQSAAPMEYHLDPKAGHKVPRPGMLQMTSWVAKYI